MSGGLQTAYDDEARCKHCGVAAVGPCARGHDPLCGDCCILTQHGAKTWAICRTCDATGGASLKGGWSVVARWVAGPIIAVALLLFVMKLFWG